MITLAWCKAGNHTYARGQNSKSQNCPKHSGQKKDEIKPLKEKKK